MREFRGVLTVYEISRNKDGKITDEVPVHKYCLKPESIEGCTYSGVPISKHIFNVNVIAYEGDNI